MNRSLCVLCDSVVKMNFYTRNQLRISSYDAGGKENDRICFPTV